jgi:hypothetical protein
MNFDSLLVNFLEAIGLAETIEPTTLLLAVGVALIAGRFTVPRLARAARNRWRGNHLPVGEDAQAVLDLLRWSSDFTLKSPGVLAHRTAPVRIRVDAPATLLTTDGLPAARAENATDVLVHDSASWQVVGLNRHERDLIAAAAALVVADLGGAARSEVAVTITETLAAAADDAAVRHEGTLPPRSRTANPAATPGAVRTSRTSRTAPLRQL